MHTLILKPDFDLNCADYYHLRFGLVKECLCILPKLPVSVYIGLG